MVSSPPSDGTFDGTTTNGGEEDLERKSGLVRGVGPQTMVASGDTETSCEVVSNCPDGGVTVERSPPGLDQTQEGNANNQEDVEPVDVLVPVGLGHGGVGDVRPEELLISNQLTLPIDIDSLLGVISLVTVGLILRSHGRTLLGEVRVDSHHASGGLVGRHVARVVEN